MSSPDSKSSTTILVAVISCVATVSAALFGNWDKIFAKEKDGHALQTHTGLHSSLHAEEAAPKTIGETPGLRIPEKPDLTGTWYVQTTMTNTSYQAYKGLVVRYKVFVNHSDDEIQLTGEKVGEVFNGQIREHTGEAKTPITLNGFLKRTAKGDYRLTLAGKEDGLLRKSFSTSMDMVLCGRSHAVGKFSSTAADSSGDCLWISEDQWLESRWTHPAKAGGSY